MINNLKSISFIFLALLIGFSSCKKVEYSFGDIKTPAGLSLTAVVAGTDASNPNGNGMGNVAITANSTSALSYKIDFGDGTDPQVIPSGIINYKYGNPGTNEYIITVNAIGTGGATSTISKKVKVFVAFEIPSAIMTGLTNDTSKIWISDKGTKGHFGIGPAANDAEPETFYPKWYEADPNSRLPCSYDDEVTFTKVGANNITMAIDNKGSSFSIAPATAFYGFSGGDDCYPIDVSGTKNLVFMNATSSSTLDYSTRLQFVVPGNGLIIFGTGGKTYEILELSATKLFIRNVGIDGHAWYQKLIVKS